MFNCRPKFEASFLIANRGHQILEFTAHVPSYMDYPKNATKQFLETNKWNGLILAFRISYFLRLILTIKLNANK